VVVIEPGFVKSSFRSNSARYGTEDAPYDELQRAWAGSDEALIGGERPGPEIVGVAIADALEDEQTSLRRPVGNDAELVLRARGSLDDAAFEEAMRGMLKIQW